MGSIREHLKKSGEKSFHAEIRLKGHPSQRASFRTKSQAKKWIQDTESAIRDGRYNSISASRRYTVRELIDRFITQYLSKHPKYRKQKILLLERWRRELGKLLLVELLPLHLADVRDKLLEEETPRGKKRSSATTNRYLAAFSKVLSFGVKELGWLQENPMQKITKPKERQGRDRFLSQEEIARLLVACKSSSNPNLYSIVSIALLTAMRYGEIINLQWKDVDFNNRFLTLHQTKNGRSRIIPLTNKLIEILKSCPSYDSDPNEYLFTSGKKSSSNRPMSIRKSFANALKKANIENFRFHDLRHTAASHLAMQGASQGELMEILGHRTPAMTRRYAHYSQGHIASVLEKTSSIIN
ncbi:MAG: site-specific integrase [Waddliaceae bacterium]